MEKVEYSSQLQVLNMKLTSIADNSLFRWLAYTSYFAYCCLGFGEFALFFNLSVRPHCPLPASGLPRCSELDYVIVVMLYGLFLAELANIAICVERTLATFATNYEKRRFTFTGITLVAVSVSDVYVLLCLGERKCLDSACSCSGDQRFVLAV